MIDDTNAPNVHQSSSRNDDSEVTGRHRPLQGGTGALPLPAIAFCLYTCLAHRGPEGYRFETPRSHLDESFQQSAQGEPVVDDVGAGEQEQDGADGLNVLTDAPDVRNQR